MKIIDDNIKKRKKTILIILIKIYSNYAFINKFYLIKILI